MKKIPEHLEAALGPRIVVVYDRVCGEPVAWGRELITRVGADDFESLRACGDLICTGRYKGDGADRWVLVDEWLTLERAIELYGQITNHDYGSLGGWKTTTFGRTTFGSRFMSPSALRARSRAS